MDSHDDAVDLGEIEAKQRADDRRFMLMAIEYAERSMPEDARVHPKVGVVVVRDGEVLGGACRDQGRHAEYQVLERALPHDRVAGATVYTTLEPCTDRTPPKVACVDRLIERRVARVVVAMVDPNPRIRGQGIRELEHVRIKVDRFPEDLRLVVEELNRDFIRAHDAPHTTVVPDLLDAKAAAADSGDAQPEGVFLESERQAFRAFLQRAEVRLSTMHRVAGAFLSGAGLLFLLPVFFRDYPRDLASEISASLAGQGSLGLISTLSFLLLLSVVIAMPIYSLYLLIRDLVLFYFIGQCPGFAEEEFYPRFALTAIAFSPDECERAKDEIKNEQKRPDLMAFAIPRSQEAIESNLGELTKLGRSLYSPTRPPHDNDSDMERQFKAILGQAGLVDRPLISEVARVEVSVARHNVHLRRLVLRYAKALLLMIWTIVAMFTALMLLRIVTVVPAVAAWRWAVPAAVFAVWLGITPRVIKMPINWIYEWANKNASKDKHVVNDPALSRYERHIRQICIAGWLVLLVATVTAVVTGSVS